MPLGHQASLRRPHISVEPKTKGMFGSMKKLKWNGHSNDIFIINLMFGSPLREKLIHGGAVNKLFTALRNLSCPFLQSMVQI